MLNHIYCLPGTIRIGFIHPVDFISYPIVWKTNPLKVTVSRSSINIVNKGADAVILTIAGSEYQVEKELTVKY